ncbi:MAG TPA: VWA domain-containing protein [Methylomirabilota bacterium]|nr:VWA domain-containing protein [Methylomirabilota bacterium]
MNFGNPTWLWLLWLLVPLAVLLVWSWRARQRLLTQFISQRLLESLTIGVSKQRQKLRLVLFLVAIASLVFSLARPQLGFSLEESKQSGLDIVIAIDTSKSMLADDVQPNRLQRAKLASLDLMRLAASDRLGLVAFAGGAFLQCPLSLDEDAFRQSVEFLDVNVIPQGGTALAEAIQTARAAFKEETENHRILVLFTDGEDNDDQEAALNAAKEARKAGMRIFTIGVGTPNGEVLSTKDPYGNRVFIKDSQGNVVKSRLNEPLLQQIARETDGFYLPLSGARTMDVLYERGLAPLPKSEFSTRTLRQYHERFQWFIGAAILLLLFEMLFPERSVSPKSKVQGPKPVVVVAALALLAGASNSFGSANEALENYQRGQYGKARAEFERLARKSPDDARLRYNAGAAAFGAEDYETALKHFNASLSARDLKLQQQSYYNLGNAKFRLGEKTDETKEKQQQWEQAIHQYENALKLDSNDTDAKFNLDVVKKKLEELKKEQQQQKQDKQDQNKDEENKDQKQDQQKDEQKKDEEKKSDEQKSDQQKQDEQKQQEQEKKEQESQQQQEQKQQDQQSAQDQRGNEPDKSEQQATQARVMQMTPQEAQQLLDVQKSEERAMIFQPQITRTNKPKDRVFKDW